MTATRLLAAVLFDLDDTLHDDTMAYKGAAQRVASDVERETGVSRTAIYDAYVSEAEHFWSGLNSKQLDTKLDGLRKTLWGNALANAGVPGDAESTLAARCGRAYNAYRRDLLVLHPQTLTLLADLRARGLKLGLITNGFSETHREKLTQLALDEAFELVFIADEVGMVKPDPALFLLACERLGTTPATTAMVGDRYDRDIRAPHELGFFTVWTNVRGEPVPVDGPTPDGNVPDLADVARVLAAVVPPRR